MKKEKTAYLEFLRIIACFLVIVNHTNSMIFLSTEPSPVWFASLTYFFFSKAAVPLFLMIMGTLLLEKRDPPEKSVRRFVRILIVLLISSALCYLYYGYVGAFSEALSVSAFLRLTLQSSISPTFWYLYLYLGLLLLLPLLQALAAALDKRGLGWLLFLTLGVMGTLPLIAVFFPSLSLHPDFTAPLFSPYIGTVFCGLFLKRYVPDTKKTLFLSLGLFLFLIAAQVLATLCLYQRDPANYLQLDDRRFLPIICSAACLYLIVRYVFSHVSFPTWLLNGICHLGGLTFGIYLLSDLVIATSGSVFLSLSQALPLMVSMFLWEGVIFLVCAVITALLKLVPGLRRLI